MRLNINLATRPYIDARKVNTYFAVALIVLSAAALIGIRTFSSNLGQISRFETESNHAMPAQQEVPPKEYQALLSQIKTANAIIQQKTFNWLGLLNRLESVVPDGVALTSVSPDIKKNELKLTGAARNFRNLRTFMESLEDSKIFTNVYLLGQGMTKTEELSSLTFDISCQVDFKNL